MYSGGQGGQTLFASGIGNCTCKVVLVGDACVGKTALLYRYIHRDTLRAEDDALYQRPTLGVALEEETRQDDGKNIKLQFLDTAGTERFGSLNKVYLRGAQVVIVVFDMGNKDSFTHVSEWINKAKNDVSQDVPIILVGNKCDLGIKKVSTEEIETFARTHQLRFCICSAKTGVGLGNAEDDLFPIVARLALARLRTERNSAASQKIDVSQLAVTNPRPRCCNL